MNTANSLASRVARLRNLRSDSTTHGIPTARPLHGEWPPGCRAFAASFAQERLWFLHQLVPELTAYHMPAAWQLRGELDVRALERALAGLIERHPTLRTSFRLQGSEVLQLIHPPGAFALAVEDLGERNREEVIGGWLEEERHRPFDLASGLLLRARLLAVGEQEHVLLVNHHHIASDGWSRSVLARDLTELYNAHHGSRAPRLAPLRVQYQDFAAWQRQRLSGERLEELSEYWLGELEGLEPLELPGDRPRPALPSHQGGSVSFQIDAELLGPFEELCRSEDATLQMGLLAAVALLLHRYSRQDDFAIGVPIWGRNHADLEPLIGLFINTLPVRTRFQGEQSFRQLLAQVRERSIGAYEHQELPFEQMVEALAMVRDTSRNPFYQVMLQLMELPKAELRGMEGQAVEALSDGGGSSKFDMAFLFRKSASGGLSGSIAYATDLFDKNRIKRLTTHLNTLLNALLLAPDQAVSLLNLLPSPERDLISSWSSPAGTSDASMGDCLGCESLLLSRIEAAALRMPNHPAVIDRGREISYVDLRETARHLATEIRSLGMAQDCLVVIAAESRLDTIIAMLACLMASKPFVVLDINLPPGRLQRILAELGTAPILASSSLRPKLCELDVSNRSQLYFGASGQKPGLVIKLELVRHDNPCQGQESDSDLAYAIFTSGSTGTPKGVLVDNKALEVFVRWAVVAFAIAPEDRILQFSSLTFDACIEEIFPALFSGATICCRSEDCTSSARRFFEYLGEQSITLLSLPTAFWADLVLESSRLELQFPASVRLVIVGGEAMTAEHLRLWQSRSTDQITLINTYGPTEATVEVVWHPLSQGHECSHPVPLGKPVPYAQTWVLDPHGQLCPIGVAGELHIGGVGLARGYLNNPELTAERFIPDPFSSDRKARLYKSGDLVSWNPDGTLAFHGRIDAQIKLRGFRIEPGEIEANLLAHPGVSQAVLVLRSDDPANPRLVGYWVGEARATTTAEELRSFVAERLPDYMVPAALVELAALPLTSNGKLDRRALPAPSFAGDLERRVQPTTELERQLHGIWAEVLGHTDFGIHDNFFAIGGHSLAAARLLTRIDDLMQRRISLAAFIREPTIQSMVQLFAQNAIASVVPPELNLNVPEESRFRLEADQKYMQILDALGINEESVENVYPLTASQLSFLLQSRISKNHDRYLRRELFLFDSEEEMCRFAGASRRVIARHQVFRTHFAWDGVPRPVQIVLRQAEPVVVLHCSLKKTDSPEDTVLSHVPLKIDLRTVTPFQIYIASFPSLKKWYAVRVVHHIAYDAATIELIDRETAAIMSGHEGSLPAPLPLGSLIATAGSHDLAGKEFFRRMLIGAVPTLLEENKVKSLQSHDSAEDSLDLPPDAAGRLHDSSITLGYSRSSMIFLALYRYLARATCSEDITVGVVLSGRTQPQLDPSRLAGPCINILPMRIDRQQTTLALLKTISQRLAGLQLHDQMSGKDAKAAAGLSLMQPLFNTIINYRRHQNVSGHMHFHRQQSLAKKESRPQAFLISRNYPILFTIDEVNSRDLRVRVRCPSCLDPSQLANELCKELVKTLDRL